MSNNATQSEKCTEGNDTDETPIHEIGTIRHVVVGEETVRLESTSEGVEFRFLTPELARGTAQGLLPDGYSVVRDDEVRR
ncbi:hypothetical protein [Halorarum salinum]|uniref:Uncharacterized protein n=1 Tax=Halorarum salinum TaxID=2743089 RepID=A0A7D5QB17_9EURY|nr:hypothetical protein [Halobaculum salinum]QLG62218.1 hypothetical protein HUG12_10940 [Halobaculum salinum]